MQHDSVYFLRVTAGMVSLPGNMDEADEILPPCFEMGLLNGHSLVMLEQIINQVCVCLPFHFPPIRELLSEG